MNSGLYAPLCLYGGTLPLVLRLCSTSYQIAGRMCLFVLNGGAGAHLSSGELLCVYQAAYYGPTMPHAHLRCGGLARTEDVGLA